MEAKCLYDFYATRQDELGFKQGDVVKIIGQGDNDQWLRAELVGREGQVPFSYVQMAPRPWFQPKMSRTEAEKFLLTKVEKGNGGKKEFEYEDGFFIIRPSDTRLGEFTLSVKYNKTVIHVRVNRDGDGKYFLLSEKEKFDSLNKLLEHHKSSSASKAHHVLLRFIDRYAEAVFDFRPQSDAELELSRGDVVRIVDAFDADWWEGECGGRRGIFPKNVVNTGTEAAVNGAFH